MNLKFLAERLNMINNVEATVQGNILWVKTDKTSNFFTRLGLDFSSLIVECVKIEGFNFTYKIDVIKK